MYHNSTIRPKTGECALCPPSRGRQRLIKGMCEIHYWQQNRLKSAQKATEKEVTKEPGLPELIEEADAVFSRYVRLAASDEKGMVRCFTCGSLNHWKRLDCGHFIPRGNHYLRYRLDNVRPQCLICNRHKDGMFKEFAKGLNQEGEGKADLLMEDSHVVYKLTREEVRQIIGEYSTKVKQLLKSK